MENFCKKVYFTCFWHSMTEQNPLSTYRKVRWVELRIMGRQPQGVTMTSWGGIDLKVCEDFCAIRCDENSVFALSCATVVDGRHRPLVLQHFQLYTPFTQNGLFKVKKINDDHWKYNYVLCFSRPIVKVMPSTISVTRLFPKSRKNRRRKMLRVTKLTTSPFILMFYSL